MSNKGDHQTIHQCAAVNTVQNGCIGGKNLLINNCAWIKYYPLGPSSSEIVLLVLSPKAFMTLTPSQLSKYLRYHHGNPKTSKPRP